MHLREFGDRLRDIKEGSSVERIEVTTIPMTKGQAKSIGEALIDFKGVTLEFTKNDAGKQVLLFEIISDDSLAKS